MEIDCKFERIRNSDVLFNSRFESGNLRQVFKVPRDGDYEWVEIEPEVPDYLPPELQEEEKAKIDKMMAEKEKERKEKRL